MLRSQHAEATRRAVLAAARRSFGRKGYAQASVDEIAAAARVTKGAVYHHFADKEALFRAVHAVVEAEAQARAAAARDPEEAPIDQIVAVVNAYLDVALDEEIRRITLIDGPALLGLEPDGPATSSPATWKCGCSSPRQSRAARSSTSTPTSSLTSLGVWRCRAVSSSRGPATPTRPERRSGGRSR